MQKSLNDEEKKKLITEMMEKGLLLSPDFFSDDNSDDLTKTSKSISSGKIPKNSPIVLNPEITKALDSAASKTNWEEIDKCKVISEKENNTRPYNELISSVVSETQKRKTASETSHELAREKGVKIIFNYTKETKKKEIQNFVKYFNARFKAIEKMLSARQELSGLTSIARVLSKKEKENVSVICIIKEKAVTANGNVMLTLEDPTGEIKATISKSKPELLEAAKDIVLDEIIGITGVCGQGIIFCTGLVPPDIPTQKELKKAPEESYVLFLSDLHFGSNTFLPDEFSRFIKWVNGEIGNDSQKEIVKKIKYIFIAGDLVDGVGIYPGQENELVIKDIYEQYKKCAELLSKIPSNIQVIVCPGNHDASRLSEPQLPLSRDYIKPLLDIPNLLMLSNPCMVNIESSENFPGFDILMYHGYSFDYFVAEVDSIRNSGGYDRADLIMKFLLQRRHLALSHSSTLHEPDTEQDPLVITKVPDFFVSGHIHKVAVSSYRGVSLICGSCWQSMTGFQEKLGHHPEPARVPMVNLQTRETKILRF
jgi:DNA polymerase II small subunit